MADSYVCKQCRQSINDIVEAMVTGCSCGCRVFKKASNLTETNTTSKQEGTREENTDDQISIKVQASGIYNVNLKTLLSRESKQEPIFVEDPNGRINVILNPDA